MNHLTTTAIILTRIDFGEADRILTLITPDQGKLRLMAKGVRRVKSKLAGGIELFSLSDITFIRGKRDIGTLVSARLVINYSNIVKDLARTMLGYELLKILHRATEDATGEEYFELLQQTLVGLNNPTFPVAVIELWFYSHMLKISGHAPNLHTDNTNKKLVAGKTYLFDHDKIAFFSRPGAPFTSDHIKLLRLAFSVKQPVLLAQVEKAETLVNDCLELIKTIAHLQIRI